VTAQAPLTGRAPKISLRALPFSPGLTVAAVGLALLVGVTSAWRASYGAALTIGVCGLIMLSTRRSLVLPVLVASVFVEILSVGGITISRLIAPIVLVLIISTLSTERVRIGGQQLLWVYAYAFWALTSLFWTQGLGDTIYQLTSLAIALIYMSAFALFLRERRDLRPILLGVALAALGIGTFAIAAFLLGFGGDLKAGREAGGTGDPNFFATYQVVALPLVLVLTSVAGRRLRFFLYGVTLVIVASVLTSLSRGGILTLVAVLAVAFAVPARRLFRSPMQKLAILVVIVAAGAVAYQSTAKDLLPRIEAIIVNNQSSTATGRGSGRVDLWLAARTAFNQHPFEGIGFGAFPSQSTRLLLQTPGVQPQVYQITNVGHEVHNAYLGTAAELGIPGLLLFLGMLGSVGRSLLQTGRRAREVGDELVGRLAMGLVVSLFGWMVASIFLSTETSRVIWIMIGISLALPRLLERPRTADV
jgi:O-antigen ligase